MLRYYRFLKRCLSSLSFLEVPCFGVLCVPSARKPGTFGVFSFSMQSLKCAGT